jgi:tellurite resistance protein
MYLGTIQESCKESVLDLAFLIANSDNEFSDSEKAIIDTYRQEMQIAYEPQKRELTSILASLAESAALDKRKILFEMAGLVIVDASYSDEEENLLKQIASSFNIDADFITQSIEIIDDFNVLYSKATKLITG